MYKAAQLNVVAGGSLHLEVWIDKDVSINVMLCSAYDFGAIGFDMDNFWYFVIPISILFVGLVIGAIAWLRCNQEVSEIIPVFRQCIFLVYSSSSNPGRDEAKKRYRKEYVNQIFVVRKSTD